MRSITKFEVQYAHRFYRFKEEAQYLHGTSQDTMKGEAFKTELATSYPDCRLVVTKETMTV